MGFLDLNEYDSLLCCRIIGECRAIRARKILLSLLDIRRVVQVAASCRL